MTPILTLLNSGPIVDFPQNVAGLMVVGLTWILWAGILLLLLQRWRELNKPRTARDNGFVIFLGISIPITSLFAGLRLASGGRLLLPEVPIDSFGPVVMVFSAAPWMLAGGLFGPLAGAIAGLFTGIFSMLWETHNLFTPLETASLALIFGAMVSQRYRTPFFHFLRKPWTAGIALALIYPLFFSIATVLGVRGSLVNRLDFVLDQVMINWFASSIELIMGGILASVAAMAFPLRWGQLGELQVSPIEKSLESRALTFSTILITCLVLMLVLVDWFVAGNAAEQVVRERMVAVAQFAAGRIPFFINVGLNQIQLIADDERIITAPDDQIRDVLEDDYYSIPFFDQLYLLNRDGTPRVGYPDIDNANWKPPPEEQAGIELAITSLPVQSYTVPHVGPVQKWAYISFIARVEDDQGTLNGIIVGRTNLSQNLLSLDILDAFSTIDDMDGTAILIDEQGRILHHTNPEMVLEMYSGAMSLQPLFYNEISPQGTRQYVYYQPADGRSWGIVIIVPGQQVQTLALRLALPLLGMIGLVAVVALFALRLGIKTVTRSLRSLSLQAVNISQGHLDQPLVVEGEDEVGQLRAAFEEMRISLKARLEELKRLLFVSQGVAATLDLDAAIKPILQAVMEMGASSVRILLDPAALPEQDGKAQQKLIYAVGRIAERYASLDDQMLQLSRQQDRLVMTHAARTRLLRFPSGAPRPQAIIAVALRYEQLYYGVLWVAYLEPRVFLENEVNFLVTLGGQAALAIANSRLFLNAEVGRQRMAAILTSTPDPVLVTDERNRLLLANPAAWRVLGLGAQWEEGLPIEQVIDQEPLLELLNSSSKEYRSLEVLLPDGRTYMATASSVLADGHRVGRVCLLRDISSFKELDALKSDFVATVSHDLRTPLALMKGYATMLDIVGELNEQQVNYMNKILEKVESMNRLVNNLLDLGRIETGVGLKLELVPVIDLVEQVINSLQSEATLKRIHLGALYPENANPLVEADQALLNQALYNLVENAIKYTGMDGEVTVKVQLRQDQLIFSIQDSGIGISPVDQPRLFEKFYRGAHQGVKQQGGSGLGLTIVKSIAERHGGRVWVESQLGKGSTFYLAIPLEHQKSYPAG